MKIQIVTLLAAISVIAGYSFDDATFNQFLADEYQNLEESADRPLHARNRRDEEAVVDDKCKQHFRKKKLCCAEESFEAFHDKEKDLRRACFKEVTGREMGNFGHHGPHHGPFDPFKCDKGKAEKMRKEMTCVVQCVGQKKDVLDAEGNPKEAELKEFIKVNMAKQSWFDSIQDKVISACLAEAKDAADNRDTSDSESCNPAGLKLMHCLFRETQMNCPAEEIKDQKACDRLKQKLKKKPDFFGGPH